MPEFRQFPEQGTVADGNLLIGIVTRLGLTNPRLVLNPEGSSGVLQETLVTDLDPPPALGIYQLRVDEAADPINVNITMTELRKNPVDGLARLLGNLGQAGVSQAKISNLVMGLDGVQDLIRSQLGL